MEDTAQQEFESASSLAPLVCPGCAAEFIEEPWPQDCPRCHRVFDLQAQFAYCRGYDAFTIGQEMIMRVPPRKRQKNLTTKEEMESLQVYQQAYSSLQQAFLGELAESQRRLGIQMMAAIARVFQQHGIVSPLESAYWGVLLTELNSQLERIALLEKLRTDPRPGLVGLVRRWRWQIRKKQLEKALIELHQKIRILEQSIAFVERPRTRRQAQ